jgi:hypothetical protein
MRILLVDARNELVFIQRETVTSATFKRGKSSKVRMDAEAVASFSAFDLLLLTFN